MLFIKTFVTLSYSNAVDTYFSAQAKIEAQRFDGWYNNLANPDWGAKGWSERYDDNVLVVPVCTRVVIH